MRLAFVLSALSLNFLNTSALRPLSLTRHLIYGA
jgi:hypothetical protein